MMHCAQPQQQQQQQGCGYLLQQVAAVSISQSDASPQQQQQQQDQLQSEVAIAFGQLHATAQQQQQQEAATQGTVWLRKSTNGKSCEGVLSCFPACKPQPSTARKAQQLLAQGRAVAALLQLCPASGSLLLTYAAQARNAALLQQLKETNHVTHEAFLCPRNELGLPRHFAPDWGFRYDGLPTARMAAAAAIRQHWPDGLHMLLAAPQGWFCYTAAKPLLWLAAAHGDAACLGLLLTSEAAAADTAWPMPLYLAMAAGRTEDDVHAPGVVALLLQELQQRRQLAAKWLRPAYAAACSSCNVAVLLQMLQAAAGAAAAQQHERHRQWHQRHHVLAVLLACAAAGNAAVWEQLLEVLSADSNASGSGSSSSSTIRPSTCNSSTSSSQQDLGQQQQQPSQLPGHQQQQQQQHLPGLHLSCLAPDDWLSLLHAVLPASRPYGSSNDIVDRTHAEALQNLREATARCSMADQLWRCLQENFPASEVAVRQLLKRSCSWQVLGAGLSAAVLCRRVGGFEEGVEGFEAHDWVRACGLPMEMDTVYSRHGNLQQQQQQQWKEERAGGVAPSSGPKQQQQQQAVGNFDTCSSERQQQPAAGAAAAAADAGSPLPAAAGSSSTAAAAAGGRAQTQIQHDQAYRERLARVATIANSCLITLAEELHPQRLLWLHQQGLLYGRITNELLIHAMLIQAGTAAVDLQSGVATNCCRMMYNPALVAAAEPLLLSRDLLLDLHGYDVAVKVYQSRVLVALNAGDHEQGVLQLQHLEQLQNLARAMAVLQFPVNPHSRVLIINQVMCSGFGAAAAAAASSAVGCMQGSYTSPPAAAAATEAAAAAAGLLQYVPAAGGPSDGVAVAQAAGTATHAAVIREALHMFRTAGSPFLDHAM
jgi:hypothetical protein